MSINITLNGDTFALEGSISLAQLAERVGVSGTRYAMEVNREIIPRSEHEGYLVQNADAVEVVQAIGGG